MAIPPLQELGDAGGGAGRAVRLNGLVRDLAANFFGEGGGDDLRRRSFEVHAPTGAVTIEPVPDVEVLLEVVAEREIQKRPPVRGELHRRGEPALDHRNVTRREMAIELVNVCTDLEPVRRR